MVLTEMKVDLLVQYQNQTGGGSGGAGGTPPNGSAAGNGSNTSNSNSGATGGKGGGYEEEQLEVSGDNGFVGLIGYTIPSQSDLNSKSTANIKLRLVL